MKPIFLVTPGLWALHNTAKSDVVPILKSRRYIDSQHHVSTTNFFNNKTVISDVILCKVLAVEVLGSTH